MLLLLENGNENRQYREGTSQIGETGCETANGALERWR
jgi:hypothetical protein